MPRKLLVFVVLVASLAGLGVAYFSFSKYAAVWRRPIARTPKCVYSSRMMMRKPSLVSGSLPYPRENGEMIYLTERETFAVHCLAQVSTSMSQSFVDAFKEVDPERRAAELLKIAREIQPDESRDREAAAAYFVSAGALEALPDLPSIKAAGEAIGELHACRFLTRSPCAKRPPIPLLVWIAGAPSAAGLLAALGALGYAAFIRLRDRWRARKAKRAQGSTSSTSTPPVALG